MADDFDDDARLRAVADYRILDTSEEKSLDDLTQITAQVMAVPICLISIVDRDRQWFKSHHGLEARETARDVAFCDHAIRQEAPLVVRDATQDPRFKTNPLVLGEPNIRFYAGVPLRSPEGHALGTLCAIDRTPRDLSSEQMQILGRLAKQAEVQLDLRRRLALLDEALEQQREEQRRKEMLAAMIVHDMRTPLTAVLLGCTAARDEVSGLPSLLLQDVLEAAHKMQRSLMDVLDVCLAETGNLRLRVRELSMLELIREGVASFARAAEDKGVSIEVQESIAGELVQLDPELVGRMLSNLLDNALQHSPQGARVIVDISDDGPSGGLVLSVSDEGPGVPEAERDKVFELLTRGDRSNGGRGLGLAFCALVANAHGGRAWTEAATAGGARFCVRLPHHVAVQADQAS